MKSSYSEESHENILKFETLLKDPAGWDGTAVEGSIKDYISFSSNPELGQSMVNCNESQWLIKYL